MGNALLEVQEFEASRGRAILQLQGELDLSTASRLAEPLRRLLGRGEAVVVDLTGVQFIDSSGIAVLLNPMRNGDRSPPLHVAITAGSQVDRVFEVVGLGRTLRVFSSPEDALNALPDKPPA